MRQTIINILLIIFLIAVVSWREVQILIDRGSWKASEHLNVFWYTQWDSWWLGKLDSFHVSNGIVVLIICYIISKYVTKFKLKFLGKYQVIILTIAYWFAFMQLRNLFIELL